MRCEQYEYIVRPFRCVLANGFLLLVGASPPIIENRLKITKLEFNNLVFELAPRMAFHTTYIDYCLGFVMKPDCLFKINK